MSVEHLRPDFARDGIFNVRDLGGLPTRSGTAIRPRRLVRGDALHRAQRSAPGLRDFGVVRVLDLRDESERERSGEFSADGVEVLHLPVLDPTFDWEDEVPDDSTTILGHRYRLILTEFSDRLAAAVEAIADVVTLDDGSVVAFHCAVGKDRTGLLATLVLDSVGVTPGSIVSDYARSASATAVQATWLRYMGFADVAEEELETGVWSARPETMVDTLTWLQDVHGGAEEYLVSAGVPRSTIEGLRAALLTQPGELSAE